MEEYEQSIDLLPRIPWNIAPKLRQEKSIVVNRHKSHFKKQKY